MCARTSSSTFSHSEIKGSASASLSRRNRPQLQLERNESLRRSVMELTRNSGALVISQSLLSPRGKRWLQTRQLLVVRRHESPCSPRDYHVTEPTPNRGWSGDDVQRVTTSFNNQEWVEIRQCAAG